MAYRIVVVGTSWGGLSALRELVAGLPAELPVPVVLVQHRHRQSDHLLSVLLQERTSLPVCEAEDKSPMEPGNIYVAPADYHLLIDVDHFDLSIDEPVRYSRPSIDVTFYSAADAFGAGTVGIVLTGANADGSRGLRRIYDRGGLAVVQEPVTAESPAMPTAAIRCVPAARVLTITQIDQLLATVLTEPPAGAPAVRPAREPGTSRPGDTDTEAMP